VVEGENEEEDESVKCPHCLTDYHPTPSVKFLSHGKANFLEDGDGTMWRVKTDLCPACEGAIITLVSSKETVLQAAAAIITDPHEYLVWPRGIGRTPLPGAVKDPYRADYLEACNTLDGSPRASAAMSRFCLQRLLRDKAGVKPGDLSKEIDQVLASKVLPSDIADDLDAIRAIGNFGAHPIKSKNTGEIVEVGPGEAEHLLTVLEELFDFYFVRPAERVAKRGEINKKLNDAAKPPLKTPPK
jgi:hypothetical protein